MSASNDTLKAIHAALAETYNQIVRPRVVTKTDSEGKTYEEKVFPTAAELAAANGFLKQNNITATPEDDPGLAELRKQLAESRRRRRPPPVDFEADGFGGLQ
jgi:hypothetical protein